MTVLDKAPYGLCECSTCSPSLGGCGGMGPVALLVTRDGKRMRLCTRCDFSTDTDKALLVRATDSMSFFDFDPLGALVIAGELQGVDRRWRDATDEERAALQTDGSRP